jgi:hypothetical protein
MGSTAHFDKQAYRKWIVWRNSAIAAERQARHCEEALSSAKGRRGNPGAQRSLFPWIATAAPFDRLRSGLAMTAEMLSAGVPAYNPTKA